MIPQVKNQRFDPIAPLRGIVYAVLFSILFWLLVLIVVLGASVVFGQTPSDLLPQIEQALDDPSYTINLVEIKERVHTPAGYDLLYCQVVATDSEEMAVFAACFVVREGEEPKIRGLYQIGREAVR